MSNYIREALEEAYGRMEQLKDGGGDLVAVADKDKERPLEEVDNHDAPEEKTVEHKDEAEDVDETTADDNKPAEEKTEEKTPHYIGKEYLEAYQQWPEEAKNYIAKREKEIAAGLTKHDELRTYGRKTQNVISKYNDHLQELGITDPLEVVDNLLAHEKVLRKGTQEQKIAAAKNILQEYNIDVNMLAGNYEPQQVRQDVHSSSELFAMQRQIQELKQAYEEQQIEPFRRIERDFIAQNPLMNNPEVYETVSYILGKQSASYENKTAQEALTDALNKAIAMHGIAQPRREVANKPVVDVGKQSVTAAKNMAVSPKNAAAVVKEQKPQPRSMREALELAYEGKL